MRIFIVALAVACTQTTCNVGNERAYTIAMKDGKTVEACAFHDEWEYPDCLVLKDANGGAVTRMCGVAKYEFGLPTPPPTPPPAENPKQ